MLSRIIKNKIQALYKQEIRYAKQCEALAAHISATCHCKISASTLKRLWGFTKVTESRPRLWTLDLIAEYCGYGCWEDLQNDLAGNTTKKQTIESVEVALLKPGKQLTIMFGKTMFIRIEYIGKHWFLVLEQSRTILNINDDVEIEEIRLDFPLLIKKIKRAGTTVTGMVLGGVTGVTEIIDTDEAKTTKQSIGSLNSKT